MELPGFAFVTGAASGIGKAIVTAFAEAGVGGVCLVDLNEEALARVASESKTAASNPEYKTLHRKVDVTNQSELEASVSEAKAFFGRIDYAVNSAGIVEKKPASIEDSDPAVFERINAVNHHGLYLSVREQLRAFRDQEPRPTKPGRPLEKGCIVNIVSTAGLSAWRDHAGYTTSKFAGVGLSKVAGRENAAQNIRVNAVLPGFIETPLLNALFGEDNPEEAVRSRIRSPQMRIGTPEEVADVVLFLCSPMATLITGASIVCDGGATAGP